MLAQDNIIEALNEKQQEAVRQDEANTLVLAGAGSGKTKVLVHRLAWIFNKGLAKQEEVMAVTFTNKAANEMRSRIESQFGISTKNLWIGTFHSLAHRILRMYAAQANLPASFQIIDNNDQYSLINRISKELKIDQKQWTIKKVQHFINSNKVNGLRADKIVEQAQYTKIMVQIYKAYEQHCQQSGLVDFAELLLRVYELLKQNQEILARFHQGFKYILIDEFQDTNSLQYAWLQLLFNPTTKFMAVGDDDQSIYAWRGAQVGNLQAFKKDFSPINLVRLEQNYRSTQTILQAANCVISRNTFRLGKNLWTEGEVGSEINIYNAYNEVDEARFIVEKISQSKLEHRKIAVLYRSNAQSRVIEEALLKAKLPYRIYGGLRFFERMEIKVVLAYLRLIVNPLDNDAFMRIINIPTRGIGLKTLEHINEFANINRLSLWYAANQMLANKAFASRAEKAIGDCVSLITNIKQNISGQPLHEQVRNVIHMAGLITYYQNEPVEKGQSRTKNLEELVTAAKQFVPEEIDNSEPGLLTFLSHTTLDMQRNTDDDKAGVQLMTLHNAKGLEFAMVFICGMEEQIFPSSQSLGEPDKIEEERRLCYVGMTRAMRDLYLTYASARRLYGSMTYHKPSRFIAEVPDNLSRKLHIANGYSTDPLAYSNKHTKPVEETSQSETLSWQIGQQVHHPKFGNGVIINYEPAGNNTRLQVRFGNETKWLVAAYARLFAGHK